MPVKKQILQLPTQVEVGGSVASIDHAYGPFPSKEYAFNYLFNRGMLAVGRTFAVRTAGGIKEYQFKRACNSVSDAVEKLAPAGGGGNPTPVVTSQEELTEKKTAADAAFSNGDESVVGSMIVSLVGGKFEVYKFDGGSLDEQAGWKVILKGINMKDVPDSFEDASVVNEHDFLAFDDNGAPKLIQGAAIIEKMMTLIADANIEAGNSNLFFITTDNTFETSPSTSNIYIAKQGDYSGESLFDTEGLVITGTYGVIRHNGSAWISEEISGAGRRVVPVTSTPTTLDQTVIYLVHDSDEDVVFGTKTVLAGTTARVYYDGNGWVAVTDGGTPTPEAIMAALEERLETADGESVENVTIPTTEKVKEMMGINKGHAIYLKRGWLTNLTPVATITNQENASKSIFGTYRYGNLQTSDELAGYALCTRNYVTAQGTLTLGNVSDLIVDVFEYDSSKALIKISRYATPLTLDANTRFIKARALKSSSESSITLEPGKFELTNMNPVNDNKYKRFITTDADDFAPNIAYEIGADNLGAGDVVSGFFCGKLSGQPPFSSQANIVGDTIISADTVNNTALRDKNYPNRGVLEKYGIELSVYTDGTQTDNVSSYGLTLIKHTLSEVDEREIVVTSDVCPVIVKHDYFPSYPFLDGESGTNDKNFVFPFDWEDKHYLSKIILKLPSNYSLDGEGVPVVAFRRGSFSFEGKVDDSRTNTGMNSVVAFGEGTDDANYEPIAGYIRDEGFAVFDFHPNGSRWNGYDGYGTPLNLHVLKCAYDWLEEVFNISHEQRFFLSKSNGGMISSIIPFHPELGIKAVAQLAPNCDTPKTMYRQSGNTAKAVAALQDMGFSGDEALNIINNVFSTSNNTDEKKKQAFKPYIISNMSKFAGYLQQYDGNITPTDLSTIYDLATNADSEHDTGWATVKRRCDVRVKTWCAGDDANVSYDICRHYIQTLQAGGSYAVLRTMPNGTGQHHSVDTSQLAPKSSGVTRLGISYTDVADAVIEVVQWFLGNNYVITHPAE